MNVISSEHAHPDVKRFKLCPGIGYSPSVSSDDHCICPVCEQPLRMNTKVVPKHRTRRD